MKLFYKPGACSMAAHLLLNEAGVPYTLEKVDTDAGLTETGAAYANTNPRGYVPALEFASGDVLTENVAILHFLGEQHPGLASDSTGKPLDRFRLLEHLSFLSSELHKAFSPYFSGKEFTEDQAKEIRKKLDSQAQPVRRDFEKRRWLPASETRSPSPTPMPSCHFELVCNFIDVPLDRMAAYLEAYVARIADRPALDPEDPRRRRDWPHEQCP